MDTPIVPAMLGTAAPGDPAEATVRAALADRYDLRRSIGRGGTATVYLAEEVKHRRAVAIKVLQQDVAASLGADRFLREIGIAARLSHPHLVPLIDSGRTGELLYYVSPYVPGGSLRDRLREVTRLAVVEALRVVAEVGAALDYVHREGFVHRDVKPENILFADNHALLADFGIARAGYIASDDVTAAGIAVGTPEYMSPEQAAAERDLDARSDLYSLACVLFERLGGEPPFAGASARVVMTRHLTQEPRSIRELRPEVGEGVDAAITRATMRSHLNLALLGIAMSLSAIGLLPAVSEAAASSASCSPCETDWNIFGSHHYFIGACCDGTKTDCYEGPVHTDASGGSCSSQHNSCSGGAPY